MNIDVALRQIIDEIKKDGWKIGEGYLTSVIQPRLEAVAAACVENGRTQAFEDLRRLIGAATAKGKS